MKKVLLLIGASSDIGASIINELDEDEYIFILLGRNKEKIKSKIINRRINFMIEETNFSEEEISLIIDKILNKFKKIDIVINCLGIGIFKEEDRSVLEDLKNSFDVNFFFPIIILKKVIKEMKKNNFGLIINLDSIASDKGFAYGSNYCSTKFALKGYFECVKEELKDTEIRITSIKPGLVNTEFFKNVSFEEKKMLEYALKPKDIAHVIKTICTQSEYSNISEVIIRPGKVEAKKLFYNIIKPSEER